MRPSMRDFRPAPATDLLAEFRKKFVALAERRAAELRAFIDEHHGEGPSDKLRDAYAEYDSLCYFEHELHRVIQAFVIEAVAPWQRTVTDASILRFDMLPTGDQKP